MILRIEPDGVVCYHRVRLWPSPPPCIFYQHCAFSLLFNFSDFGAKHRPFRGGRFEPPKVFREAQNTPCYLPLQIFLHYRSVSKSLKSSMCLHFRFTKTKVGQLKIVGKRQMRTSEDRLTIVLSVSVSFGFVCLSICLSNCTNTQKAERSMKFTNRQMRKWVIVQIHVCLIAEIQK